MADDTNQQSEQARRRTLHAPLPQPPAVESAPAAPQSPVPLGAVREEDPRTRAARRALELREHRGSMDDGTDKFHIDPKIIPDGWSYEWKAWRVLNAENPGYQVSLARNGWEAVPAYRHPEMMPTEFSGNSIDRDGMRLMERPLEITNEVKALELRKAREQVNQKEAALRGAPVGAFEGDNKGTPIAKFGRSYEPMSIPK